jgi:hypothetical protein
VLYNVAGHALLQGDALGLGGTRLEEEAAVAERVLGLRGDGVTVFTAAKALDAARAVAMQVSLQVSQDPEAFLASSVGRSGESISYREGVILHPVADAIVAQLFAELDAAAPVESTTRTWPITGGWRG